MEADTDTDTDTNTEAETEAEAEVVGVADKPEIGGTETDQQQPESDFGPKLIAQIKRNAGPKLISRIERTGSTVNENWRNCEGGSKIN